MKASNVAVKRSCILLGKSGTCVRELSCLVSATAVRHNSMWRSQPRFLAWIALLGNFVIPVAPTRAESVIIPAEYAMREGEDVAGSGATPGEAFRWQWLYHSFLFPSEPISITGIRMRPKASTGTFTIVYPNLQLSLATTNDMSLQASFSTNLNNALHAPTVLINGNTTVGTTRQAPPKNPKGFDYEFNWAATPFRYDPRDEGNLLLDFNARGGVSGPPSLDMSRTGFFNHNGQSLRRTVLFNNFDSRFPVVEILYRAIPEPASSIILLTNVIAAAFVLRRRPALPNEAH